MAVTTYIKDVNITSNGSTTSYLIEPALYGIASVNNDGNGYNVSLPTGFALIPGATIQVKFTTTNTANATLNVNSLGATSIYYNGAQIAANTFKANHIYTLVYDNNSWHLTGDINTNTQRPIGTGANDAAAGNHGHGNITNNGKIGTAGKKKIVIVDTDNAITTGAEMDSSTTNQWLNKTGNWSTPTAAQVGAATSDHNHNTTYLKLDGTNMMSGNIGLKVAHTGITNTANKRIYWETTDTTPILKGYITISSNGNMGIHSATGLYFRPGDTNGDISNTTGTIMTNAAFYPYSNKGLSLGIQSTNEWSAVYATAYYGSAANMTSLTGASNGNYGPSAAVSGTNGTTMNVPYIQVDANGRITSISNKVYTAVNTWRGIQDNLTSSSNTTESLSAKQGYLLANGSARDDTKLPLAGGIMTGNIRKYYASASSEPLITVTSNNQDIYLWQLGHGNTAETTLSNNGYKLLYKGTNSTTNNYLQLIARNANGAETIAVQIDEIGNVQLPSMNKGSATKPIYLNNGVITEGTAIGASAYHADNYYATAETVNGLLAAANALVYKGVVAGAATSDNNAYGALTPAANCGDTYKVSVAGFINGLRVEIGDMLICTTDDTEAATASNYTTIRDNWNIIQTSEGSVSTSSTSSTDNAIARFDGTSGRIIKSNSYTTLDDNGHISITHKAGSSTELQFKYSTTIDYWWGVGTGNENHGLYDVKASKWILSAGANNTWTFVGNVTGTATNATNATNLVNKPSLAAGTTDTNKITVTAGGKTSDEFTVPYATYTKYIEGTDDAASPSGALLRSGAGRSDNASGNTWIFWDTLGGTTNYWGLKHDQANNKFITYGSKTVSSWIRLNTGDTYLLGKLGLGYNPETSGNTYKLYVNGTTYLGGNTTLEGSSTISRAGKSINWNAASTYAPFRMTSKAGWSPLWALKSTNGWWTMGHYDSSGFSDHLLFTLLADVDVAGVSNAKNHMDYTVRLIPTIYATNTSTTTDRAFVTAPWASSKATVGSTKKPVYINDEGVATEISYTIEKSVPSNAVFTDHYAWGDITNKPTSIALTGAVTATATTLGSGAISITTTVTHDHGYISSTGQITETHQIANGDRLIVTDSANTTTADKNKLIATAITFDGSTATKALTQKGTWETFNNYSHPTSAGNKHIPSGGSNGQFLKYGGSSGTATWSDLPTASSDTAGITKIGASGGAAAYSHTHSVADLTWGGGVNLKPTATANNQEWSIDLTPGSYTGTYWHVWSAKNSSTILACYPDTNVVKIENGPLYIKTIQKSTRIYPWVASQERSNWYKITFPYYNTTTTSNAKWFMNSFDLHFGGGYQSNPAGVAHIIFYWTRAKNNGAWGLGQGSAKIDGILMNKIKLYYRVAEPGVLYVNNESNVYNGIWLDNLFVDDTAPTLDWSTTTIATCSAITADTDPAISAYTQIPSVYTYTNNSTTYCIDNLTQLTKDFILYAGSGNSPSLIFKRGETSSLTDWRLYVTSGKLSFCSALDGTNWTERAYFKDNTAEFIVNKSITAGARETSTSPSNETEVDRIIITPYFHTGGPWKITSADDNASAFLKLFYGSTECLKIKHDGTFMSSLKASITGNAATVSVTDTAHPSSGSKSYYLIFSETKTGSSTMRGTSDFYLYRTKDAQYLNLGADGITSGITFHTKGETSGKYGDLVAAACTAYQKWTLPNATGTIALTSSNITGSAASATNDSDGNAINTTYIKKVTSTDNAIVRFDGTSGAVQDSTSTINDNGTMTINGRLVLNPKKDDSTQSYNEGIRINQSTNGWANIQFGGADESTSGTADGQWLAGRRGAAGSKVGAIGDFSIEEQNSIGGGLTLHKDNGGITLYSKLAYNNSQLKIWNDNSIAASKFGYAINALSTMAANSNSIILVGAANSNKNQAYLGFHYEGSGSNSNYLTLGLYGVDHLLKIFPTGQVNITTNITSDSTSSGSLVVAGGAGIAGEVYIGNTLNLTNTNAGAICMTRSGGPAWIHSTANVIAFCANSASLTSANSALRINTDTVDGYTNNYAHLGSSSVQWKDVHSYKYIIEEKVTLQWNETDQSLDFVFA